MAPAAMMALSKVTVDSPSAPATLTVWSSVNVAQPLISVILFFFIKKCTPLTIRSETARLREKATPKLKLTSPSMPNVLASAWKMWASSALRNSAFVGMHPTFRQTPPQYLSSMMAVDRPSCAARIAAT